MLLVLLVAREQGERGFVVVDVAVVVLLSLGEEGAAALFNSWPLLRLIIFFKFTRHESSLKYNFSKLKKKKFFSDIACFKCDSWQLDTLCDESVLPPPLTGSAYLFTLQMSLWRPHQKKRNSPRKLNLIFMLPWLKTKLESHIYVSFRLFFSTKPILYLLFVRNLYTFIQPIILSSS